jgi:TetR/AcrR family transcriptional regulator
MPIKNTGTEQLIKDTAKKMLFAEGKFHATTQEIADAAGVNRTSLHYYYRTRDLLVAAVFQDAMKGLSELLDECLKSELPFKKKVEQLMKVFLQEMIAYPYQETFLVTQINTLGLDLIENIESGPINNFLWEVADQMEKGTIEKMNPIHFLMNLFSLLSYPLIMSPLYQNMFNISSDEFDSLINDRSAIILKMIFKDGM